MIECGEVLRKQPTDWDSVYFQLRASPIGADFPRDVFVRTPITVIRWALREINLREQERINAESITTARLIATLINVAHAFSGSKRATPKINVTDYLPYPAASKETSEQDGPDDHTKLILAQLGRTRQIPPHVMVALMSRASDRA